MAYPAMDIACPLSYRVHPLSCHVVLYHTSCKHSSSHRVSLPRLMVITSSTRWPWLPILHQPYSSAAYMWTNWCDPYGVRPCWFHPDPNIIPLSPSWKPRSRIHSRLLHRIEARLLLCRSLYSWTSCPMDSRNRTLVIICNILLLHVVLLALALAL